MALGSDRSGRRGWAPTSRRRQRRRRAAIVTTGIAVAAGALGVLAAGHPTDTAVLDPLYRALFAAVVTIATARARRWTWLVLAAAAGVFGAGDEFAVSLAGLGIALTILALLHGRRQREFGALVGLLCANSLLRLPTDVPFGVPSIVAAAAPLPVFWTAWANVKRPRRITIAVLGVLAALGVVGAVFAFAMLDLERRARDGIDAARDGVAAAQTGDRERAAERFAVAAEDLTKLENRSSAWWLSPVRAVPVLSQQLRAVDEITEATRRLAVVGADQIESLDPQRLRTEGGEFDLDAMRELAPRADRAAQAVEDAVATVDRVDDGWLLPPLAARADDLRGRLGAVAPLARNAADALHVIPHLLGESSAQRYLVLVGNPAEARELGGFVSGIGVVTAENGVLRYNAFAGISALGQRIRTAPGELIDLPAPLPAGAPTDFVQNWTDSVDFAAVDELARRLGPDLAGAELHGTLYLDPYVIAQILDLVGPVALPELGVELNATNAVDYLLRDQYVDLADRPSAERSRLLDAAVAPVLERLFAGDLPPLRRVVETLAPLVDARRLALRVPGDVAVEALLERVGLGAPLDPGGGDVISVGHRSIDAAKQDAYLERSLAYDVTIDADGTLRGVLRARFTNTTPANLPNYVTAGDDSHSVVVGLYHRATATGITVDDIPVAASSSRSGALNRTAVPIVVPAGQTVEVAVTLRGRADPGDYQVTVVPTAGAAPDQLSVTIDAAGSIRNVANDLLTGRRVVIPG